MNTLNLVQSAGKSLEIDVSVGPNGELFIGHPVEFYAFKHMEVPSQNLPIDTVIELAKLADLYLVIDCKDERALPWVEQIIEAYGVDRVLFHSWIDVFKFEPYPEELEIEPHWHYEDLSYDKVIALKQKTGVPVVSSVRGLTLERLQSDRKFLDHIIEHATGKIDAINFNLPFGEAPTTAIIDELSQHNLLVLFNIDQVDQSQLPNVYIGYSDHITYVSTPSEFN